MSVGHEAVGTVVEIGPEVTGFAVGDRVLVSSVAGCGHCGGCATQDPIRCVQGPQIFGTGFLGGAQAELLAVPAANFQLLKMPDGISTEQALLLTDNLATGWAAAKRADIPIGGSVAVIGLGAVGMCALRSAITLGAAKVFAVDLVEARRDRAAASGATTFAPPSAQAIREATGGLGVDSVIDAVGMDASINDAIDAGPRRRHGVRRRRARSAALPDARTGLPPAQPDHPADHRTGTADLARADPAAAGRPARRRRNLHHHDVAG